MPVSNSTLNDEKEESVYRWIPKKHEDELEQEYDNGSKKERSKHKSIYREQTRNEYKARQQAKAATFGPLKVALNPPNEYLHKKDITSTTNTTTSTNNTNTTGQSGKNKKNTAPLWEPKYPKAVPVQLSTTPKKGILRNSDRLSAEINNFTLGVKKSTELPVYREKKDYGRVPEYLLSLKQQQQQQQHANTTQSTTNTTQSTSNDHMLSEVDRLDILNGLKQRHEELMLEYQKLPLVIDTVPKKMRKVGLESELKQVESDMEMFSCKNIIISNT